MNEASAPLRRRFTRIDFFRYSRLIHGWLSAIAFLVLCFFAISGLLLNHPEWKPRSAPPAITRVLTLTPAEVEQLAAAEDSTQLLAQIAATKADLRGEYSNGEHVGDEMFVRLQGVRGLTDLRANLVTGRLEIIVEPATAVSVVNELHRGERAGASWRWFVDAVAILLLMLSIVGYVIFLSLRFRLRTALLLTSATAVGVWTLFIVTVQ